MTEMTWIDYGSPRVRYIRSAEEQRVRDQMAAFYRSARMQNPMVARLIYRRVKAASEAVAPGWPRERW